MSQSHCIANVDDSEVFTPALTDPLPPPVFRADRTDITIEGWGLAYLRTLPQTQFPEAFLSNLTTIFRQYDDGAPIVTPDGKSLEDWEENERPYFLKKGELRKKYCKPRGEMGNAEKAGLIMSLAMSGAALREELDDEMLFRFQQEYWRRTTLKLMKKKKETSVKVVHHKAESESFAGGSNSQEKESAKKRQKTA